MVDSLINLFIYLVHFFLSLFALRGYLSIHSHITYIIYDLGALRVALMIQVIGFL